jgi:hypothetical protein
MSGYTTQDLEQQLTGDHNKVTELPVEDKIVYVIGIENIFLDRLRSAVHWQSGVDREWGYRLLIMYFEYRLVKGFPIDVSFDRVRRED